MMIMSNDGMRVSGSEAADEEDAKDVKDDACAL